MTLSVDLRHAFPGFALEARFDAPPGVTALFGRSGSGKTTLAQALAGLLRPDQGRIALDGTVLVDRAAGIFVPPHRRRIGYVFQDARLFPHLSVRQNLTYGRWFAPVKPAADAFDRIVDLLGIAPLLARRPAALSGGETSRVALGRAILSAPRMLVMDEPLAALDAPRKAEILPYLEALRDAYALPILYVSHAPEEVTRLATTLVLLDQGRVTAAGPVADILSDPVRAPGFGLRQAGGLLTARVVGPDGDGLTRLDTAAGPVWLPGLAAPPGAGVRLRILAQDVTLATQRPDHISALNILPALVRDVTETEDAALVRLTLGSDPLLARITLRSARALDLRPGRPVFAILKAMAVAPGAVAHAKGA